MRLPRLALTVLLMLAPLVAALPGALAAHETGALGFEVTVEEPLVDAGDGRSFDVVARVRNTGERFVHVVLTFEESSGEIDVGGARPPTLTDGLEPGEETTSDVTAHVKAGAPDGTYTIRVRGVAFEDSRVADEATMTVRYASSIEYDPATVEAEHAPDDGAGLRYVVFAASEHARLALPTNAEARETLVVWNGGTRAVTLALDAQGDLPIAIGGSASDDPDLPRLSARVEPATLSLAPGERARVDVIVQGPRDLPATIDRQVLLTVRVEEAGYTTFGAVDVRLVEGPAPSTALWRALADRPALVAAAGVAAAGVALALVTRRRDAWRYALAVALYTRIAKERALDHAARERIHARVAAKPGITWTELQRDLAMPTGALVHHVRALERAGLLASRREGARRRFHVPGARAPDAAVGPDVTPTQARILALVHAGPLPQREIAARLGLVQQAASAQVKALERRGLVRAFERGGERVIAPVAEFEVVR